MPCNMTIENAWVSLRKKKLSKNNMYWYGVEIIGSLSCTLRPRVEPGISTLQRVYSHICHLGSLYILWPRFEPWQIPPLSWQSRHFRWLTTTVDISRGIAIAIAIWHFLELTPAGRHSFTMSETKWEVRVKLRLNERSVQQQQLN